MTDSIKIYINRHDCVQKIDKNGFSILNCFFFKFPCSVLQTNFNQRYWVNKDYWKNPNGPVFLVIGGEGESDNSTVMAGMFDKFKSASKLNEKD